jgi:hypothetical protein
MMNNMMKRLAILLALLLSLPLFAAEKRRSVGTPDLASGAAATVSGRGTVTDAATGLPIAFATITAGKVHFFTSRQGTFSLSAVARLGDVDVTASRTGYHSSTVRVSDIGRDVNFRLQSRPTAALRKTDGTTVALDDDSVQFGYVAPFVNYQTATGNDFCMVDGTHARIPTAQMMRITGLGVSVETSCCQRPGQRVLLELRDGTIQEATFIDSCYGAAVDLLGRDHDTGEFIYVPFGEVSEIVFP